MSIMFAEHIIAQKLNIPLCTQCGTSVSATTEAVSMDVVGSHVVPSEQEVTDIQHAIRGDEVAIVEHTNALRDARRVVADLERNLKVLEANVVHKRALLSPVRRLPADILSLILSDSIMRTFRRRPDSTLLLQHPLLRVCRWWRELGLGTPRLWARIVLFPLCDVSWYKTLALCLQYSKEMPLSICLSSSPPIWRIQLSRPVRVVPFVPMEEWKSVTEPLLTNAFRWRDVRLDGIELPNELLGQTRSLPLLEVLQINNIAIRTADYDDILGIPIMLFRDCPRLRHPHIEHMFFEEIQLPWAQFTALDIVPNRQTGLGAFLSALRECISLQALKVDTMDLYDPIRYPALTLPALTSVELVDRAACLLDIMIAPRMRDIRLEGIASDIHVHTHLDTLLKFAQCNGDSAAGVTSLKITADDELCDDEGYSQWTALLTAYSGLSVLRVEDHTGEDLYAISELARCLAQHVRLVPGLIRLDMREHCLEMPALLDSLERLFDRRGVHSTNGAGRLRQVDVFDVFDLCEERASALRAMGVIINTTRHMPPRDGDVHTALFWSIASDEEDIDGDEA